MPIKDWEGKIENTEIVDETIEKNIFIHQPPISSYAISSEKDRADKVDCMIAASSGVITASMDILWIGEFSILEAQSIGTNLINKFVISFAKSMGCKKNELKDCIRFLEKKYPLASDKLTNEFGGGLQHHLRDFSHHASPFGLVCSILNQFTLKGYGTDAQGYVITPELPYSEAIGENIKEKIWLGVLQWVFHLISDMAGSSGSTGRGTGIPGPILSLGKVLSATPLFRDLKIKYKGDEVGFSVWISKLFNGTAFSDSNHYDTVRFDLRTELGLGSFATKQAIPVFLNQCIVRSFYFVRRLAEEYSKLQVKSLDDSNRINIARVMPFNNKCIDRMITIATGIFTILDGTDAFVHSWRKSPKTKGDFIAGLVLRLNFVGIGAFAISVKKELGYIFDSGKPFKKQELSESENSNDKMTNLMECVVEMETILDNKGIYEYSFYCMAKSVEENRNNFTMGYNTLSTMQKPILSITDERGKLFNMVAQMSVHSILYETGNLIMRLFKNNNVTYIPFSRYEHSQYFMPFYRNEDGGKIAYIFSTNIMTRVEKWKELREKYKLDGIKVVALIELQEDEELIDQTISFQEEITDGFVKYSAIKEIFNMISENEYNVYLNYAQKFNQDVRELIGYSTISIPSKDMMFDFKEQLSYKIRNFDYRSYLNEFSENNINLILHNYIENERFRVVLGEGDLAESFLSAEWYYSMRCSTSGIEQTAIIAGYIKSIEQLLYQIIRLSINSGKKIRKKNDRIFIQYSTDNEDDIDYTLGSMIQYVKYYSELWEIKNPERRFVIDALSKYRIKCRNDHFHRDNIHKMSDIDEIRNQTFVLFALLLGGTRLSKVEIVNMLPYSKFREEKGSLAYNDVEKWLDAILAGDNLLNPEITVCFMVTGHGVDKWKIDFCTVNGLKDNKYIDVKSFPYRSLIWPKSREKDAEGKVITYIQQYLDQGIWRDKLKQHNKIFVGKFANPVIVYEKNIK